MSVGRFGDMIFTYRFDDHHTEKGNYTHTYTHTYTDPLSHTHTEHRHTHPASQPQEPGLLNLGWGILLGLKLLLGEAHFDQF